MYQYISPSTYIIKYLVLSYDLPSGCDIKSHCQDKNKTKCFDESLVSEMVLRNGSYSEIIFTSWHEIS